MEFSVFSTAFWLSVGQIIAIDILLGGDNAVVIALACRRLSPEQRRRGIVWGVAGAVVLRIVLIFFALQLLTLPLLKVFGALLLLWIGIKLLLPDHEHEGQMQIDASGSFAGAIRTIIIADAVMSLDNVIAVAGAAKGSMLLAGLGIACSIPIIVWGSAYVMRLMDRFPVVITLGAALLGWIAGEMLLGDVVVAPLLAGAPPWIDKVGALAGALLVVALGRWLARRRGVAARLPREIAAKPHEPDA